jgi:hypothetical protein
MTFILTIGEDITTRKFSVRSATGNRILLIEENGTTKITVDFKGQDTILVDDEGIDGKILLLHRAK